MPMIKGEVSVPANSTIENVISGSTYERLPWPSWLEIGLVGSATGLLCTVQSGTDVLLEEAPISIQNRFAIYPEDFDLTDAVTAGDLLKIKVRNTTAGALTLFHSTKISPI